MKRKKCEEQYERGCRKIVLEGESGCGKTTLIRKILGTDVGLAGGFITARICDSEELCGFVLAPVNMLQKDAVCVEEVQSQKLPCFLSFSEHMKQEELVFSRCAVQYLKQAVHQPFAVVDEIGGVELLEDTFYEELLSFLQSGQSWICVLKSEKSADAMSRRVPLGERYWERYRMIRKYLETDKEIQHVYMSGFDDIYAEQAVKLWKERQQ